MLRSALPVLACVSAALAAPRLGPENRPDGDRRLVGEWSEETDPAVRVVFRADGTLGQGRGRDLQEVFYRVDSTATPKRMDWSLNRGKTWFLGVYEVTGDRLEVNLGQGGTGIRPESVEKADRFEYRAFRRKKSDK